MKVNHFVSFKFGNFQLLDILTFLGGAKLDVLLHTYETMETKAFFPYENFNHPYKLNDTELFPKGIFYKKIWNCNPLWEE